MKVFIDLPDGGRIRLERRPMDKQRFDSVLFLLGCLGAAAAFVTFIAVLVNSIA